MFAEQITSQNAWWRFKWKLFRRYWPFVREIHRWLVISPHKGQWCGALMFSLICSLNKRLSVLPETGIKVREKQLHPIDLWDVINCPCHWYVLVAQHSSFVHIVNRMHPERKTLQIDKKEADNSIILYASSWPNELKAVGQDNKNPYIITMTS